jgi:flagellar hook-associated protein 1
MADLMGSMSIALGALKNSQEALDVTSNNIANLNTPGYSRQRVNVSEGPPIQYGRLQFGSGANIDNIQSIRDQVLEFRINSESGQQSSLDSYLQPMQQIQAGFNEAAGNGLQSAMSGFFNSLTQLSTNPANIPMRQNVITAAQGLSQTFNNAATNLATLRSSQDQQIPTVVQQINTLTQGIAQLNLRIGQFQSSGQNPGIIEDQRNALINKLSALINVTMVDSGNGVVSISTAMGAALVVGGQDFALTTSTNAQGMRDINAADGTNLTKAIDSGQLGGILRVRDKAIPTLQTQLDTLANGIATAVNTAHKAGVDLNGNPGVDLFTVPATVPGSAASIKVNITDPKMIAASQAGPGAAVGDNANALVLAGLQGKNIVNGQTPVDYYSNTVSQLGSDIQLATTQRDTQAVVVGQLQTQRNSVSGVSMDEEAANLVRFQRAYQAAARVVNTIDQMTQVAINLGTGA